MEWIVGLVWLACRGFMMMGCGSCIGSFSENVNLLCRGIVVLGVTAIWEVLETLGLKR